MTLPAPLAARANEVLSRLVEALVRVPVSGSDASLITGATGLALAFAELEAAGRAPPGRAAAWLAHALELFNAGASGRGLHEGLAGLGFVIALRFPDDAEALEQIDQVLEERLGAALDAGAPLLTSLRNGLAGLLRYGLERGEHGDPLVERALTGLERLAARDDHGLCWPAHAEYLSARGVPDVAGRRAVDLGVAHGQAGVLFELAQVSRRGAFAARAKALLEPGVAWLLTRLEGLDGDLAFIWVDGAAPVPLNHGTWCTGTPGGVAALLEAATAVGHPALVGRARAVCEALATSIVGGVRPGLPGRVDLCCGLSGVAISLLEAGRFVPAAQAALSVTVERLLDEHRPEWVADPRLQFGAAGIALTLAAALGDEARWRRAFCAGAHG